MHRIDTGHACCVKQTWWTRQGSPRQVHNAVIKQLVQTAFGVSTLFCQSFGQHFTRAALRHRCPRFVHSRLVR